MSFILPKKIVCPFNHKKCVSYSQIVEANIFTQSFFWPYISLVIIIILCWENLLLGCLLIYIFSITMHHQQLRSTLLCLYITHIISNWIVIIKMIFLIKFWLACDVINEIKLIKANGNTDHIAFFVYNTIISNVLCMCVSAFTPFLLSKTFY